MVEGCVFTVMRVVNVFGGRARVAFYVGVCVW
jgi:hypothetical protein